MSSPIISPKSPQTFDKCYEITDEILGGGANGPTKTVVCKITGNRFVLKTLDTTADLKRKEAKTELAVFTLALGHENLVQMKDVFQGYSKTSFILEKLGGNLHEYCIANGTLKESDAALVIRDVAKGLSRLHKSNVAHRDVKLENMFYSEKNFFPIKLGDYGLCSNPLDRPCCASHGNNLFSTVVGTTQYLAPEIVKLCDEEPGHYTKQCDMWSLGIALYAILYGKYPFILDFDGIHICQCVNLSLCCYCDLMMEAIINFEIPRDSEWESTSTQARDLMTKLLVADPNERYTADEVLEHSWIRYWEEMQTHMIKN